VHGLMSWGAGGKTIHWCTAACSGFFLLPAADMILPVCQPLRLFGVLEHMLYEVGQRGLVQGMVTRGCTANTS
jgi:hypothetical protein